MRFVAWCLVVIACGHEDGLTPGFGPRVEPPGGLRYGMTVDEARAALPGLELNPPPDQLYLPSANWGLQVKLDDGRVREATFFLRKEDPDKIEAALAKLWGPPGKVEQEYEFFQARAVWRSGETGWRAYLSCRIDMCQVWFRNLQPIHGSVLRQEGGAAGPLKLAFRMTRDQARRRTFDPDRRESEAESTVEPTM
jgi:hypothetical protein